MPDFIHKKIIEGCIDKVRDGVVYATLIDGADNPYSAEIDLDRFDDADQPMCAPGVLFTINEPGPTLKVRRKPKSVSAGR